jgi:hypothetical protein
MKKILSGTLATLLLILAIPASSMAAAAQTDISGNVTNGGNPVKGASVTVVCNGHTKHTTTGNKGGYLVVFTKKNCPDGSSATVSASKSSMGGSSSGTVNSETNKLNVAVVNVSVPELGTYAAIAAGLIGGGAFLVIRRRNLSENKA